MGRSPSPYRRRFRSPSPRRSRNDRYRGDWSDQDREYGRDRGDRRRERGDRDRDRDWDTYYRRRERDVTPPSASASASGAATGAPSSRGGSPEEGQITSPEPVADRERERGDRRRSRSPFHRTHADRNADRYRGDYEREREWDDRRDSRDGRERDTRDERGGRDRRVGDRGRDRGWGGMRSPLSPRRRSQSPSSTRSSHSRRDTRSISPRRRSPEPRTAPPLRGPPPSAPRAERAIPTGPRAFNPPTIVTPLNTSVGTPGPASAVTSAAPTPRGPAQPYGAPITPGDVSRLAWADRRKLSGASPSASPGTGTSPLAPPATPAIPTGPAKSPASVPRTPIVDPSDPEAVARAREARIKAELPVLKVPFVGVWESELAAHTNRMAPLVLTTIRAQAAMRVAVAVLADAEAERAAAGERRKMVEEQLNAGSMDGIMASSMYSR